MRKLNIFILCSLMMMLAACSKEDGPVSLPEGSVTFQQAVGKDSIQREVSLAEDPITVIDIKAVLSGAVSSADHRVSFAIDTTKIADFRARYGNGVVLPATSYLFYKPNTIIPAGSSVSDAAQLNFVQQSKLIEYTTYVLPVVIKSVDGNNVDPAVGRVLYYVFKTGKPVFINKVGWEIAAFSSQNAVTLPPTNVLDANKTTTYWLSSTTQQMPQYVTIDFKRDITFSGVSYSFPTAVAYPTAGGYPTSIQIETSMDGTTWVNKGIFAGNLVDRSQTLNTGLTTARYLRFTCLASAKYSTFFIVFISDISLMP